MKKFRNTVKIFSFIYPLLVFSCVFFNLKIFLYIVSGCMIFLNLTYSNYKILTYQIVVIMFCSALVIMFSANNLYRLTPFLISLSVLYFLVNKFSLNENIFLSYLIKFKKISEIEKKYLDKLIIYWIIFLSLNTLILFYLVFFLSQNIWLIYSCFVSYLLIILMIILSVLMGLIFSKYVNSKTK